MLDSGNNRYLYLASTDITSWRTKEATSHSKRAIRLCTAAVPLRVWWYGMLVKRRIYQPPQTMVSYICQALASLANPTQAGKHPKSRFSSSLPHLHWRHAIDRLIPRKHGWARRAWQLWQSPSYGEECSKSEIQICSWRRQVISSSPTPFHGSFSSGLFLSPAIQWAVRKGKGHICIDSTNGLCPVRSPNTSIRKPCSAANADEYPLVYYGDAFAACFWSRVAFLLPCVDAMRTHSSRRE